MQDKNVFIHYLSFADYVPLKWVNAVIAFYTKYVVLSYPIDAVSALTWHSNILIHPWEFFVKRPSFQSGPVIYIYESRLWNNTAKFHTLCG